MLGKIRKSMLALLFFGTIGLGHAGTIPADSISISNGDIAEDGLNINGKTVTATTGGATIGLYVGTDGLSSDIRLNGTVGGVSSGIVVAGGGELRILNANYLNTAQGVILVQGNGINYIEGNINASRYDFPGDTPKANGFDLSVRGNLLMQNSNLIVDNLSQVAGTISGTASTIKTMTADDTAKISGRTSVFGINGDFAGGLDVYNGATLLGTNNTINLSTGKTLTIQSANIDLREGNLTVNGAINFNGGNNIYLGASNVGTPKQYVLDATGQSITGNISNSVRLDSSYSTYYYDKNPNGFISSGNHNADTFIKGNFATSGSWIAHNVFGDFGFKYDNTGAWLDSYNHTDVADINQVKTQLSYNWDSRIINTGIASDVSVVAQDLVNPSMTLYSDAGRFNYAALEAMANGNSYFTWNGGNGIVDKGLVSAMNGSNLSGVNYVAQDVARDIFTSLHSRLDAYRAVAVDIASETALGSVADVLNDRYLNRIWAGGLGSWTNAKERKGFEGYKYDGKGVMLGYDRAFGAAILGIAGAYVEGDYEDKSAASHDSKIKNYAVNAYMTYNASSGFFATLSGGWVYSDNDIRERRAGYWATEDYHTNTWHAEAKLGYDIQPCDNWSISPSVGVNFIHAKGSAHDLDLEGVAGATRSYSSAKNHRVEIPVEIQAAYEVSISDVTRVTFMANGGYAYNLNDHAVRGTSITNGIAGVEASHIVGRKLGHSSWKAGAGVMVRHDNWDLGVKYDYYGRDKYRNHRLMGSIGYSF